ncbi:uncharacterized protein LOC135448672 [Zonotrichia leucophrys gambelii]|uniref:uncharacterized protein LOC135448672 n=1 Tax=Zonotrichia leucophrys gambelii TaxID=257770 RepID=UPI0031400211
MRRSRPYLQILLPLRRREEGSAPPAALPPEPCPSRRAGTAGPKRRCRGEPGAPHLSLIAAERARERKLPQTRQQNAGFRRLRASFLHTTIINLRAEIKDPRAKEIIDSARKRFPGAAHGRNQRLLLSRGVSCVYLQGTKHSGHSAGGHRSWRRPCGTRGLGGRPSLPQRRGPNFGSGVSVGKHEKRCEVGRQEKRRASCAISHKGWPAAALGPAGPGAERDPPGSLSPPWAGGDSSDPHPSLVTGNLRKPLTDRLLPLFETLIPSFPP